MSASPNVNSKWKEVLGYGVSVPITRQNSLPASRSTKFHNSPKPSNQCQLTPSPSTKSNLIKSPSTSRSIKSSSTTPQSTTSILTKSSSTTSHRTNSFSPRSFLTRSPSTTSRSITSPSTTPQSTTTILTKSSSTTSHRTNSFSPRSLLTRSPSTPSPSIGSPSKPSRLTRSRHSNQNPSINSISDKHLIPPLNTPTYPRFPREITFFHRDNEVIITESFPVPSFESSVKNSQNSLRPLFYISLTPRNVSHKRRPDITLHAGADKASTAVCFSKIYPSNPVTDLTLCPPPKKSISANFSTDDFVLARGHGNPSHNKSFSDGSVNLYLSNSKTGELHSRFRTERLVRAQENNDTWRKYIFSYAHEAFEWKYALRQNCRENNGNNLRLAHVRTGQVIALAFISIPSGSEKTNKATGVMRFRRVVGLEGLAEEFEILAVVGLMSIVEKERRECFSEILRPVMNVDMGSGGNAPPEKLETTHSGKSGEIIWNSMPLAQDLNQYS